MKTYGRKRRKGNTRRPPKSFKPPAPLILAGKFKGRRVDELLDDELQTFLKFDAKEQNQTALPSAFRLPPAFALPPSFRDLSHYWCAKYELDRRKSEVVPIDIKLPEIHATDSATITAQRLFDFAYKLASKKHHPDHGGSTEVMKVLNAAREFMKARG